MGGFIMKKKTALEISVEQVLGELGKAGYCQSTIRNFKKVYERLLKLATIMQTDTLSDFLADHFANDSAHTRTGQYCHSRKKLHKSCIKMLREYEERGYVGWQLSRESKVDKPATTELQDMHTHFLAHLRAEQKSKNTSESYRNISCKFLIFIEHLGYTDLKAVPLESIHEFFNELRNTWEAGSLRTAASGLRSFLNFAEDGSRLLTAVPGQLLRKRTIIPVLTQDEEHAVWDVLQTDAVSSRDKAIMTLALLTGLRAADILTLKLRDIDWQRDVIYIIQKKTNEPLVLPLLPAMGNALVRYIANERPTSDSPFVFLSCNAPHQPLKEHASCYAVVKKIFSCAGIRLGNELKGTRLLRHHIASKMLRRGVALQTISSTLGHVNPDTTDIYLTTDEERLRDCASTLALIPMKVEGLL
jgi:site-specific recombinase XerD